MSTASTSGAPNPQKIFSFVSNAANNAQRNINSFLASSDASKKIETFAPKIFFLVTSAFAMVYSPYALLAGCAYAGTKLYLPGFEATAQETLNNGLQKFEELLKIEPKTLNKVFDKIGTYALIAGAVLIVTKSVAFPVASFYSAQKLIAEIAASIQSKESTTPETLSTPPKPIDQQPAGVQQMSHDDPSHQDN